MGYAINKMEYGERLGQGLESRNYINNSIIFFLEPETIKMLKYFIYEYNDKHKVNLVKAHLVQWLDIGVWSLV
jgi:hypothetical protein